MESPRIIRSPFSDFYGREIEDALASHPEDYLREVAEQGFNGVWLHCVLRDAVPSSVFPEFGKKHGEQLPVLNRLIERAGKYGLKIFLYFCEPRGFAQSADFWRNNADVRGQPLVSETYKHCQFALCSSTRKVRDFLSESSYRLFRQAPGLGGAFMITASEFHTHCYSHYPRWQKTFPCRHTTEWAKARFFCKSCESRHPSEVVAEIITLVNGGIKTAEPGAEVIAWNWSWNIIEPEPQKKLISLLPEDVILMADFERGGYRTISGRRIVIDEYSFSYIGPSPRFSKTLEQAKKRNMRTMAKIQIGTTHELVTVPYIPVPHILAEKISRMRKLGIDGYLGCWIFGGDVSVMSKTAGRMSLSRDITPAQAVKEVALDEFKNRQDASCAVKAWRYFSRAWKNYPFSIPFLYFSPLNYATAYPLSVHAKKKGHIESWLSLPRNEQGRIVTGDNIETWADPFPRAFINKVLMKFIEEWNKGIAVLKEGALAGGKNNLRYMKELDLAFHILYSFESILDIMEFYRLLKIYRSPEAEKKKTAGKKLKALMKKQLEIARQDREIISRNRDFGYHSEAHSFFVVEKDLDYKIQTLEKQIKQV